LPLKVGLELGPGRTWKLLAWVWLGLYSAGTGLCGLGAYVVKLCLGLGSGLQPVFQRMIDVRICWKALDGW
jgi:hypothetical protein